MAKVIINREGRGQYVLDLHSTGKVIVGDVVWDEREDGVIPIDDNKIGSYKRSGGRLVEDAATKAWHDAAVAVVTDEKDKREQERLRKQQLKDDLSTRAKDPAAMRDDEIKDFLKKVIDLYG